MDKKQKYLKLKKKFNNLYGFSFCGLIISLIMTIWLFSLGTKLFLTCLVLSIFFWGMGEACDRIGAKVDEREG